MLVLSRRKDQQILIGDNVVITVVRINGGEVRIGIEAPKDIPVLRAEVPPRGDHIPDLLD